jgi:ParB/RepB/Spo0J family partition protein
MAELRSVDPGSLIPNPNNPRRTAAPKAMDDQLLASVTAIGIIQPPLVVETDGSLVIIAGGRRTKAAIAAGLPRINVLVCDADEATNAMRSVSENLVRTAMTSVDIWRAIETLAGQGWNEQAIGDALALPTRTVRRLKLLANLHPAMLDAMAAGSMPSEEQLRTIANASHDEQAQVWKKYKPRKGEAVAWQQFSNALSRRRMPFSAARFDDDLARAYGVIWDDDLFAPAGEDGRTTTNVDGFFGAQQEWMQNNLPPRGVLLQTNEYGHAQLPKHAETVWGKAGKRDTLGHYLDARTGEVKVITYRMPETSKAGKKAAAGGASDAAVPTRTRPDVTQKGMAMIGDLRTDALHQALREAPIDDQTLIALLVLALGGKNVSVQSGAEMDRCERRRICHTIADGGALTSDPEVLRGAARRMLVGALSCRENATDSGIFARIAGDTIGATLRLPNMATPEFLACLSRTALEKAAGAEGVRVEVRGKDTRARLVERFKDGVYVYPEAAFAPTAEELADAREAARGWNDAAEDGDAAEDSDGQGGTDDTTAERTEACDPAADADDADDAGTDDAVDDLKARRSRSRRAAPGSAPAAVAAE